MAAIHVSQAEAARDFNALMAKVKGGNKVVVEENAVSGEVLHAPAIPTRSFEEIIAMLPRNSPAVIDEDFARDVAYVIELHREPLDYPEWD